MDLYPYRENWAEDDPHANFKAEVAQYSELDPLPTLENLSRATGIPVPCLARYILVKYTVSGKAEMTGTDAARLAAYEALRQMIGWLSLGAGE